MKIANANTDTAVLAELGVRLERIRLAQNRSQAQLAAEAGVSKRTLERIEAGEPVQLSVFLRVLRALGLLERLDSLVPEPLSSPLDQLRRQGRRRHRAAPRADEPPGPWTWDDP